MRAAFSNALYYPTIDIQNTDWLKTAILFWDSISTIVPESLNRPYRLRDTEYLADIGFLRPLTVNSVDKSVVGIEEDIMELMFSPEFLQAISAPRGNRLGGIFGNKMSYRVKENFRNLFGGRIYAEKMSHRIREQIHDINRYLDDDRIYYLDEEFAYVYMVTLANKLCEDHSLGMITDDVPCFNVGNTVRFGNQTTVLPEDRFLNRRPRDHQFEQGLLLDFIINGLSISPDTDFASIVAFKEHHGAELGRFRTQLSELTKGISTEKPIEVLRNEISDLYRNNFIPAFEDFKAALKGSRIKSFMDTFVKVSLLSVSTTGTLALLGLLVEQAVFAGAGVSVISSAVSFNLDKKKSLRENPYAYLLSVKREWA